MSFLSALALAVALLVVAPYVAHRLRRRKAEEQPFPPARLVAPAPPKARRRSRLEERALFATRAAAILLLAVLGATPFVRCSRLSLQRSGGASVALAIVVDDSMSMRAAAGSRPRFDRARAGARELLASAREGDAVAVVLAGAPARVVLAATTDLSAARASLEALVASDRATDLEGALSLARGLVSSLPQVDRRVVVLSDLADGKHDGPPLGEGSPVPVWIALPDLAAPAVDCAVLRADREGQRVRVTVACSPGASPAGRDVVVEDAFGEPLGHAPTAEGSGGEAVVPLPSGKATPARAHLVGVDAIAFDDVAPVLPEAGRGALAVVAEAADEAVPTGGAPIVEQALSALKLDVDVRPIPVFPDRAEDLAGYAAVLLDDPAGLTPEQRRALETFLDGGGAVLVALGPHAAAAPLGASLEPLLGHPVSWSDNKSIGVDPATALGELSEPAPSLLDVAAPRRAAIDPQDASAFEAILRWSDGAPLVARRAMGRGEAWIVALPFSVESSDFALRPAFLSLLDAWVRTVQERIAPKRSDVGSTWRFPGAHAIEIHGPSGDVPVTRDDGVLRSAPPLLGTYGVAVDGKTEVRVAAPEVRELDLRPRPFGGSTQGEAMGERRAAVDVSGPVALALLGLVALEMALRIWARRKVEG